MMSLRSIKCQRGQAVVELTFSFLIFMTVFYGIIEFLTCSIPKLRCRMPSDQPDATWSQEGRGKTEKETISPETK